MQTFTAPLPQSVATALNLRNRKSHFRVFDSISELVSFAEPFTDRARAKLDSMTPDTRGVDYKQAHNLCRTGDESLVPSSDEWLAIMERHTVESAGRAWRDDIAGSFPNVPAFVAGVPMNMRRRVKTAQTTAPLAIIVDIGCSSGVTRKQLEKRGAAIVALVRILAALRPIEFWVCAGLDADNSTNASWNIAHVDTAPLNLGQAAFLLTHPAAIRRTFWCAAMANGFEGTSPYHAAQCHRSHMRDILAPVFPHVEEMLCVPRAADQDESLINPEAWLAKQIARVAPQA